MSSSGMFAQKLRNTVLARLPPPLPDDDVNLLQSLCHLEPHFGHGSLLFHCALSTPGGMLVLLGALPSFVARWLLAEVEPPFEPLLGRGPVFFANFLCFW